VGAISSRSIC